MEKVQGRIGVASVETGWDIRSIRFKHNGFPGQGSEDAPQSVGPLISGRAPKTNLEAQIDGLLSLLEAPGKSMHYSPKLEATFPNKLQDEILGFPGMDNNRERMITGDKQLRLEQTDLFIKIGIPMKSIKTNLTHGDSTASQLRLQTMKMLAFMLCHKAGMQTIGWEQFWK